jgi:tetratricopeptide (TPR) repeat protein
MCLIKTTTTLIIFCLFITTLAYAQTAEDYYNSGLDKYDQQDYKGSIADYNKAIELNPNLAEAYNNRGNAKSGLKDYMLMHITTGGLLRVSYKTTKALYRITIKL